MGPVFGIRVAGISVDHLETLRFSGTWTRVDELIRLTDQVDTDGRRLAEILYGVIGSADGTTLRPAMVALRRDLFHARTPQPRIWSPEVRAALPAQVSTTIAAWLDQRDRLSTLEATLAPLLADELSARTAALRRAVTLPAFRQGLAQSSTSLSGRLAEWLDAADGTSPSRQTALRLAKYLARATMKTSPYATFTASGLGGWTAAGQSASFTTDLETVGVAEVDRSFVNALWSTLAQEPALRDAVELRVNPSATEEDGRIWFLGPGREEPVNSVPAADSLREVLSDLDSAPGTTRAELVRRLAGEGASADETVQAGRLLDTLIDGGLLERRKPFADQCSDPVHELVGWLRKCSAEHRMVESLLRIRASADAYARCPVHDRLRWRRDADRLAAELAEPGRLIVHENALLPGKVATRSRESLRQVEEDLGEVRTLLAAFDPSLPAKIAAADLFLELYGAEGSASFLAFYRRLHESAVLDDHPAVRRFLHRRSSTDGQERLGPRIEQLRDLRRRTWDTLSSFGSLPVPAGVVRELGASWPSFVRPAESISCYGQLMGARTAPTLVVNMILAGPRTGIGRIQHLLGSVGEPHDDPALAEFRTDVDSNLNLRPQVVRAIDYPLGGDAVGPKLRLADLRVGHDHESGLLWLRAPDGSVVRPVHLGLLTLAYLPPAQSLMTRVFGVHPAVMVGGWALRDRLRIPPASELVHRPRLTVGTVVIARASWRMSVAVFPKPGNSEPDGAYLIRLARWLRDHGVPRRFFARIIDARGGRYGSNGKGYKPVYIDVTNWFLLQDFVRSLHGDDRLLVLEEVLPDLFEAPRYGEAGAHVTEYIFDVNGRHE